MRMGLNNVVSHSSSSTENKHFKLKEVVVLSWYIGCYFFVNVIAPYLQGVNH